ncbi:MAG: hypothetical protein ABIJ43_02915 [Candidatus Beckwithbacteria bacterium]|nr:hypothetical protein [Patescibacteria group bacterium]
MSLAINLTPAYSHSGVETCLAGRQVDYSAEWTKISRTITTLTKSTAFKAVAEITTLLTVFVAVAIWMFAI